MMMGEWKSVPNNCLWGWRAKARQPVRRKFPNTPEGHNALMKRSKNNPPRRRRARRVCPAHALSPLGPSFRGDPGSARLGPARLEAQPACLGAIPESSHPPGGGGERPGSRLAPALPTAAQRFSPDLDVGQWVAYAGLAPRQHSSGSSVHKKTRISKTVSRHLRRPLYMTALVTVRHEPHLRAFYLYLVKRGKTKMQALVAVMRKLLHALYGMFKHQQPFDGSQLYRLPQEPSLPQPPLSTTEAAWTSQREKSPAPSKEETLLNFKRESTLWAAGGGDGPPGDVGHPLYAAFSPAQHPKLLNRTRSRS